MGKSKRVIKEVGLFGIFQHTKGRDTDEDHFIVDVKTHRIKTFVYRASAEYWCSQLNNKYGDFARFTVVRLD